MACLERALAGYARLDAPRDAARVRRRLRRLGVRRRPARGERRPATGWAALTDTERAVAAAVAQGLTNRQVAVQMFLSPHTVGFHLRQIFRKLGIRSRVELARLHARPEGARTGVPPGERRGRGPGDEVGRPPDAHPVACGAPGSPGVLSVPPQGRPCRASGGPAGVGAPGGPDAARRPGAGASAQVAGGSARPGRTDGDRPASGYDERPRAGPGAPAAGVGVPGNGPGPQRVAHRRAAPAVVSRIPERGGRPPLWIEACMSDGDRPVVGVIDYQTGNSQSVVYALDHLGVPNRVLKTPDDLEGVDRVILPGVGSAGTTMDYLAQVGWPQALRRLVVEGGMPFLGVCVGLQVMFESSAEQDSTCLGWLPGRVRPFDPARVRVPQMGWNRVRRVSDHPFLAELPEDGHFYFVNSYYVEAGNPADVAATTTYGTEFASVVARANMMGTQFHTEKSGPLGLRLLHRFATLPREELC